MSLPLLVSVPHAGERVPDEIEPYVTLTPEEIRKDGDVGARAIYMIDEEVERYVTTDVARAIVDMNRAEDDRRPDGVVKTHTCWNVPVYDPAPPESLLRELIERYHGPYHALLTASATAGVRLGVDCHTMAASGPPVGPDPGRERPAVCLSHSGGTCPDAWLEGLARCLERSFGHSVSLNAPFTGGYIVRSHAAELPWIQLELSRAPFLSDAEKRRCVVEGLKDFCSLTF